MNKIKEHESGGIEFIGDDCWTCHAWPRKEEDMHLEHHPDCTIGKGARQLSLLPLPPKRRL